MDANQICRAVAEEEAKLQAERERQKLIQEDERDFQRLCDSLIGLASHKIPPDMPADAFYAQAGEIIGQVCAKLVQRQRDRRLSPYIKELEALLPKAEGLPLVTLGQRLAIANVLADGCEVDATAAQAALGFKGTAALAEVGEGLAEEMENVLSRLRYEGSAQAAPKRQPEQPAAAEALSPRREPEPKAFLAYRLWKIDGKTQTDIAKVMYVSQKTIHDWCKKVKRWCEAGNTLPDVESIQKKIRAVAPDVLEMGKPTEGRTPRQRHKRIDD